jgi:DNA-binding MarR family transcriptional regulator
VLAINQEQFGELVKTKSLTGPEWVILAQLLPMVEHNTNALVEAGTNQYATVSMVAKNLQRDLSSISKLLNSLIQKGILLEITDINELKKHGRCVTQRPLFLNPEVGYSGNLATVKRHLAQYFNSIRM